MWEYECYWTTHYKSTRQNIRQMFSPAPVEKVKSSENRQGPQTQVTRV